MTAFVVSLYSCVYRPFAPFRSPAGETFELIAPDRGIRCIGEKVGDIMCLPSSMLPISKSSWGTGLDLQDAPQSAF